MGFFSSIGGLFGGSKSTEKQSSGYGALPQIAQQAMDEVTRQGRAMLLNGGGANIFTPLAQTAQENQAFNLMQLPTTQEGVNSLTSMYLNPFQNYLTDQINQQAQGDYSLYKQALSDAGQMGSNREFLNAAAADKARMSAIGQSLAGNYNNALSTGLGQNQQNIANLLSQGAFQRELSGQTNQAGLSALQAMAQLLGVYPATSEGTSTSKDYGKGLFGNILGAVSGGSLGGKAKG